MSDFPLFLSSEDLLVSDNLLFEEDLDELSFPDFPNSISVTSFLLSDSAIAADTPIVQRSSPKIPPQQTCFSLTSSFLAWYTILAYKELREGQAR